MENKKKLLGTRIFIDNDLTWNERRTREKTLGFAKYLRSQGKKVKIGHNRIIGEHEEWIWDKAEQEFFQKCGEDRLVNFLECSRNKKKREGGMGGNKKI